LSTGGQVCSFSRHFLHAANRYKIPDNQLFIIKGFFGGRRTNLNTNSMKLKLTALTCALFLSAAAFAQDEPETLLGKRVKVSGFD
jgi:hypothetical protein